MAEPNTLEYNAIFTRDIDSKKWRVYWLEMKVSIVPADTLLDAEEKALKVLLDEEGIDCPKFLQASHSFRHFVAMVIKRKESSNIMTVNPFVKTFKVGDKTVVVKLLLPDDVRRRLISEHVSKYNSIKNRIMNGLETIPTDSDVIFIDAILRQGPKALPDL